MTPVENRTRVLIHTRDDISEEFNQRQQKRLINRGFDIITTPFGEIPEIAIRIPQKLQHVPFSEFIHSPSQILQDYSHRHLRHIGTVTAAIVSQEMYSHILIEVELKHPGTLRNLFLVDPEGYRRLSGYYWIANTDRDERNVGMIASYNGKNLIRGSLPIHGASGEVGVLPIVIPKRVLR